MEDRRHKRSPPNIKFRLLSPDTFDETIILMNNHFFPREPISICLNSLEDQTTQNTEENTGKQRGEDWLINMMKLCTTTIIAQDSVENDKVVGVVIAGIGRQNDKDGTKEEWYDMEIPNEELLKKWSERNVELTGKYIVVFVHFVIKKLFGFVE